MSQGMIHRLIDVFLELSSSLCDDCPDPDMERLAIMVHRIMSYQARQFHTLEHVFGFLEGADPSTALAAIFHDLIYHQVDDGLPPEVEGLLRPYLAGDAEDLRVATGVPEEDRSFHACRAVFGFEPGRPLGTASGLNEFLSALAMMKLLEGRIALPGLIAVAACIEASIPFRSPDAAGRGPGELLEARLEGMRLSGALETGKESVLAMVGRAMAFANSDVRDFALADPGRFLSNTWKLLPEANAPLRKKGTFSVREYRVALEKMQGFFRSLPPSAVFHSWRGQPDAAAMERLERAARRNLASGRAYLQAKLLAVGLLEAVAELSGGDAPMALFMGDLPLDGSEQESLVSYLPVSPAPPWLDPGNAVYLLLSQGRLDESSFDLKNSPMALYLYCAIAPASWQERSKAAEAFFAGRMDAAAFLLGFERSLRDAIIEACCRMVPTRRAALKTWVAAAP